ncbi:hypothetical protein GCM10028773_24650 [Spirosoma koreense]
MLKRIHLIGIGVVVVGRFGKTYRQHRPTDREHARRGPGWQCAGQPKTQNITGRYAQTALMAKTLAAG